MSQVGGVGTFIRVVTDMLLVDEPKESWFLESRTIISRGILLVSQKETVFAVLEGSSQTKDVSKIIRSR